MVLRLSLLSECLWLDGWAAAQIPSYKPGEYPAPNLPSYKQAVTVNDLLPIARVLARKPAERQPLTPGYAIKPGEKVLILVAETFDDRVLGAIRTAHRRTRRPHRRREDLRASPRQSDYEHRL